MTTAANRGALGTTHPGPIRPSPGAATLIVTTGLIALGLGYSLEYRLSGHSALVQVEQYLLLIYASIRAGLCLRKGSPRVVALMTWLFVYGLFCLVQIVQLSKGDNPFHVPMPDPLNETQLAVILIGCVAFDVVASRPARDRCAVRAPSHSRVLTIRRVRIAGWATVIATIPLAAALGGLSSLFGSRSQFGRELTSNGQVNTVGVMLTALSNVAPFLTLLAMFRLRAVGAFTFSRNPDMLLLLSLLIIPNVLFNNPISQPRYWVATMVVSVALFGRWVRRRGFQVTFVAAVVVGTIYLFPYLDVYRNAGVSDAAVDRTSITSLYLNKTDYGSAQDIRNALSYVQDHGYKDGRQIATAALFFIPRAAWPGKGVNTAQLLATEINFPNQNLDTPLWAEGYIDFGWTGVVLFLAAWGAIARRCDRGFQRGTLQATLTSILVPVIAGYALLLLRGSLLQATGRLAMILIIGMLLSVRPRCRSVEGQDAIVKSDELSRQAQPT